MYGTSRFDTAATSTKLFAINGKLFSWSFRSMVKDWCQFHLPHLQTWGSQSLSLPH